MNTPLPNALSRRKFLRSSVVIVSAATAAVAGCSQEKGNVVATDRAAVVGPKKEYQPAFFHPTEGLLFRLRLRD